MINVAAILERYYLSPHKLRVHPLFVDMGSKGKVAYKIIEVVKTKKINIELSLQ